MPLPRFVGRKTILVGAAPARTHRQRQTVLAADADALHEVSYAALGVADVGGVAILAVAETLKLH